MWNSKFIWVVVFILFACAVEAQVKVYPDPDPQNKSGFNLKSAIFKVQVIQNGKAIESFVYSSQTNFEKPEQLSDFNHWTTFEFHGKIEVCVTRLDGDISSANIYPTKHNIAPVVKKNKLRFSVDKPCKLFIDIAGMEEHPLFLFADEMEQNIPSKKDKNVIWFEAGKVHNVGLQYKVPNGKTVYIEGGAVVWGTFWCNDGNKSTVIKGKGVITTRSDERKPGPTNIPFTTVYAVSTDMVIEGVTITDPVKFCILGRSKVETKNVKLFAWYHQTDGWGGGDDSFIDDSFIKVFDDNVKLYGNNQQATNLVIYQQHNGAPFQLSWGGQSGNNCIADNIDIVKCWVNKKGGAGNSGLLNLRKGSDKFIGNITIKNVRADQGLYQLLGIGNDKKGVVSNLVLENIFINEKQSQLSYLENGASAKTTGIILTNVKIGAACFSAKDISIQGVDPNEIKIACQ
ncbi:hypothetical protein [Lacibacter sp.]|uniref:hypothetical protein n=1 Tax=Lacibacter sp. TaxID=1915409 RepID=UPI002B4AF4C9|nr:hypothetical protein [Lacibacter sp.]HLP37668.1 hypothetical protein [Lacibacter sp.]